MNIREFLVRQQRRVPWYLLPGMFIIAALGAYMCYQGAMVEHSAAVACIGLGFLGFAAWFFLTY